MLILPIINKQRVMNVELRLKSASKIKKDVHYEDAEESEIIVNHVKFTESSFANSKEVNAPIDFIRSKSLIYSRNFLITTKQQEKNKKYDIYEVSPPLKKVNDDLDQLYSKAITDMRKEIPGKKNRGRYISLEELGIEKTLSDDKMATLQSVLRETKEKESLGEQLKKAGIEDLEETIQFFNQFECTILSDSIIPEDSLCDTLEAMSVINSRDFRNLNKYYKTAKANTTALTKLSYLNKLFYDRPIRFVHSTPTKQKQFVKKKEDFEHGTAA